MSPAAKWPLAVWSWYAETKISWLVKSFEGDSSMANCDEWAVVGKKGRSRQQPGSANEALLTICKQYNQQDVHPADPLPPAEPLTGSPLRSSCSQDLMRMLAKLDRIRRDVEQADTTGCCWRLLQYAQLHLMDDLTEEEADSMAARGLFWKWTDVQKLVVLGLGSFESTSGESTLQAGRHCITLCCCEPVYTRELSCRLQVAAAAGICPAPEPQAARAGHTACCIRPGLHTVRQTPPHSLRVSGVSGCHCLFKVAAVQHLPVSSLHSACAACRSPMHRCATSLLMVTLCSSCRTANGRHLRMF